MPSHLQRVKSDYTKPWKSYNEQLELLRSRGMTVSDENAALRYLEQVGYYRLSGYWYPFRVRENNRATDRFAPNTHLQDAVQLYLFDKKLRLFITDALERIEIALRVDVAHLLGEKNQFAHHDRNLLHPSECRKKRPRARLDRFEDWHQRNANRLAGSKEEFVRHYREKYGEQLPIWVAVESWDFGAMSTLFSMMRIPDKAVIAGHYGLNGENNGAILQSWLHCLNYLRNMCAHHSRVWNRNIVVTPKLPNADQLEASPDLHWCSHFVGGDKSRARVFLLLAITRHLIKIICPHTEWHHRVAAHLQNMPTMQSNFQVKLDRLGAPSNWLDWWN